MTSTKNMASHLSSAAAEAIHTAATTSKDATARPPVAGSRTRCDAHASDRFSGIRSSSPAISGATTAVFRRGEGGMSIGRSAAVNRRQRSAQMNRAHTASA
jgi:hypothetical protein